MAEKGHGKDKPAIQRSQTAASSTAPPPLPSLLLGLRSSPAARPTSSISRPTSSQSISRPHLTSSPTKSLRSVSATSTLHAVGTNSTHPAGSLLRRTTSTLSITQATLSPASVQTNSTAPSSPSIASTSAFRDVDTPHPDAAKAVDENSFENESELAQESDSSGFQSLLQRVGARPTQNDKPRTTTRKSSDSKGKQREIDSDVERSRFAPGNSLGSHSTQDNGAVTASAQILEQGTGGDGSDSSDSDDSDGQVEIISREDGQPDPREMLRAQLKRNQSQGGKSASRTVSSTTLETSTKRSQYSPRRYFILSSAGKLIFTTDKNEEEATGYVGVMSAIISIFADEGDRLRYVDAGSTKICFLLKAPIYLVCVSDWGEPEAVLRNHLDYLYLQILSIVTLSQLNSIFSKRSNFDLRRLMEGTEPFFTSLVDTLQTSLPILTGSLEVYRIDPILREQAAKALSPGKSANSLSLLYALIITNSRVVTLIRPAKHSIHPTDLNLLISTLNSSTNFREPDSEFWIPICLPRFNNKGFLHAYVSYMTADTGLVLISAERDNFQPIKEMGQQIKSKLMTPGGILTRLEKAKLQQFYSLGELSIPGLRHFLYKSRAFVQISYPNYEADYQIEHNKIRLITLYQKMFEALHPRSAIAGQPARPPAKLVFLRTEFEAVLGWTTAYFELYVAVSPLLPKSAVVAAARAVSKWIEAEESKLFLTTAPTF